MKQLLFLVILAFSWFGKISHAGQRSYSSVNEIRKLLQHHPRLREEYLYFVAENPGVRMAEAHVRFITVIHDTGGDRYYTCEINTQLVLTSGNVFSDEVEVERKCDDLFR